jgi:hypothetical protein
MFPAVDFSCWLLVAITVERAIAVCWPLKVNRHCTANTAVIVIVILATMAVIYSFHTLVGMDIVDIGTNGTVSLLCIPKNAEYEYFFEYTWANINLVLVNVGPFCVLLVGNACIIIKIKYGRHTVSSTTNSANNQQLNGLTLKVIGLSIAYMVCTTPVTVYTMYGLGIYGNEVTVTGRDRARRELGWAVVNLMLFTNSVINFPLYCLTGGRFTAELKEMMLTCCRWRNRVGVTDQ